MPANFSRFRAATRTGFVLAAALAFAAGIRAAAPVDLSALENLQPARPAIPARVFKLTDFGANGNGQFLNTAAFKKAIAAVEKAGGGKLVVPKGVFRTGPFTLCSHLELQLEPDAVIRAADVTEVPARPGSATAKSKEAGAIPSASEPLIGGKNLQDVALTGAGMIDGSGAPRWARTERISPANVLPASAAPTGTASDVSPPLVAFEGVQRLLVSEVTLSNSPSSFLVLRDVTDFIVERLVARAPADDPARSVAIDLANVTRGQIRQADLATGGEYVSVHGGVTELLVEACVLGRGRGISFLANSSTGIRHVVVRQIVFDGPQSGLRFVAAGGPIENVRLSELVLKNTPAPLVLRTDATTGDQPVSGGIHRIQLDRLQISNAEIALVLRGTPARPITDVTLRDVTISAARDFEIQDADEPTLERVHTTLTPAKPQP